MQGVKYKAQTNQLPFDPVASEYAVRNSGEKMSRVLRDIGIDMTKEVTEGPVPGTAPRIFLFEDGKLVTPKEKGMDYQDLAFAATMGKVFVYPDGEKDPVQLQGEVTVNSFRFHPSQPIRKQMDLMLDQTFPPEPAAKPQPKWYHRLFRFLGGNRRIVNEYEQSLRDHAKWEADCEKLVKETGNDMKEATKIAGLVDEAYTPLRTEQTLSAEREQIRLREIEKKKAALAGEIDTLDLKLKDHALPVQYAENIYAPNPKPRKDWLGKIYTEKNFNKLKAVDYDPAQTKIGGQGVTEREFAALAMFGTFTTEIALQTHKQTVADPQPLLNGLAQEGFTLEDSKEVMIGTTFGGASIDLMSGDSRMDRYFECAVNPGRECAAEALKAYPGDKTKLAEILSRAVEHTGGSAGTVDLIRNGGPMGLTGLGKLCGEMIDLMKRDPELEKLAKEAYEKREKGFCERNKKLGFKFRSWESQIKSIRALNKLNVLDEQGLKAQKALLEAEQKGTQLTPEQKKAYVKDALKANIATNTYRNQKQETTKRDRDTGKNKDLLTVVEYSDDLKKRTGKPDDQGVSSANGNSSSLPSTLDTVFQTGVEYRVMQKPQAMLDVDDPQQMDALDKEIERMIEKNGIDRKPLEELNHGLGKNGAYQGDNAMELLAQSNVPPTVNHTAPVKDLTRENEPVKENAVHP